MIGEFDIDVTVIGGGPAGSLAALLLVRRGHRVRIIEQHRFPRTKVCGECLNRGGIEVLARAGIASRLAGLSPAILEHTILHAPDGASTTLALSKPMWGLSRAAMDSLLLDQATAAGAMVFQPARCERIKPGVFPIVHVRNLNDNHISTWRSRFVLLADGKGALLPNRAVATGDFGMKAHFRDVSGPVNAVELFGVDGHYGGIAAIEDGSWNIAFNVPGSRLGKFRGDLDGLFATICRENPTLARRMNSATRTAAWVTAALPRFAVAGCWPINVIPLGNAAAALEPIGGEGMSLALRSAELAANAVGGALIGEAFDADDLRRQFDRLWRVRRAACRAMAIGISWPPLAEAIVPAAASCRSLGKTVMAWMNGGDDQ